jgi:hypothetical protein
MPGTPAHERDPPTAIRSPNPTPRATRHADQRLVLLGYAATEADAVHAPDPPSGDGVCHRWRRCLPGYFALGASALRCAVPL